MKEDRTLWTLTETDTDGVEHAYRIAYADVERAKEQAQTESDQRRADDNEEPEALTWTQESDWCWFADRVDAPDMPEHYGLWSVTEYVLAG